MAGSLKILIIVLLLALIGGGAYYVGTQNGKVLNTSPVQQTNLPQTQTPQPTPTDMALLTVNAGGFGSSPKYTINVATGWQEVKTVNNFQDLLTISKDGYQLQINQTNMGNGPCSYSGATPEPMSQAYTSFISLPYNGDPNFYRRSKSQIPYPNGSDQYAICQKSSAGSYLFVTSFGSILYMAPTTADPQALSQMDQMVQSMQKK